jgi:hypothetical protein
MLHNNNKFINYNYNINNILKPSDINLALNNFYVDELINVDPKLKFAIFFKIITSNDELINISSIQITDKTKLDILNIVFNTF